MPAEKKSGHKHRAQYPKGYHMTKKTLRDHKKLCSRRIWIQKTMLGI